MYLLKVHVVVFHSNLLSNFNLLSYAHGILRKWVVTFSCIKYVYLLKVYVFLLFSDFLPKFNLLSYAHGILRRWVIAFPCIMCTCKSCMYFFSFPIFYPISTCCLMHMVFSAGEFVAFPCIKYVYLLKLYVFLRFSNLLPNFNLLSYAHGILSEWVVCSHVLSMCSCWKTRVCITFPIFYPNFTCHLIHMVFSAGELLPSHVLSTCCCCKCIYFFSFPIFYPNSTCCLMYVHGIFRRWVIAFLMYV